MVKFTSAMAGAILAGAALAHPGHDVEQEARERRSFMQSKPRSLATCASKLNARGHTEKGILRRAAIANELRARLGIDLDKRDLASVLNKSHHSDLTGLTATPDEKVLFSDNSSCILQPETTEGPYYVSGELIRSDVRNNEEGVDTYVYIQVVDTSTCEPVTDVYVDFWHCNSTGVYSGVVATGNGYSSDTSNLNNTAFRGLQATDSDGVVEFVTAFPGHYTGRATHIHIMTHSANDSTVYPNGTLGTDQLLATHVGQLFFDQSLISQVEVNSPYTTNTQNLTTNAQDGILSQEAATEDPMMEYVLLGNSITDGLLAWATIGINLTYSRDVSNAAYYGSDGGHATSSGGGGFGNGSFSE